MYGFVICPGTPGQVRGRRLRKNAGRRLAAEPSSSSNDNFNFDWELMNKRISHVRERESERAKESSRNWRSGNAKTEVVALLPDDYFRRIVFCGPGMLGGSHTGFLHRFDLRTDRYPEGATEGAKNKLWTVRAHRAEVTSLDYNGKYVLSGAVDGTVFFGNTQGEKLNTDPNALHSGIVSMAKFCVREGSFFTGSVLGELKKYDLSTGNILHEQSLTSGILCGSVVGKYVLLGCRNGSVEVFTADKVKHILTLNCMPSNVTCMHYDEESDRLCVGGANGEVAMWNLQDGSETMKFTAHSGPVMSLQWDEDKIITGGRDGTIRAWDTKDGTNFMTIGGFTSYLTTVQFDRNQLICDGTNNVIVAHRFWTPPKPSKPPPRDQ